ncbi:MAG: SRPBCC family protein [Thermodesulfobacteriota bacterium]
MAAFSRKTGILSLFLVCFLLLLAIPAPQARAQDPGGEGWVKRSNGKTYNTYRRDAPGSDNAEVKLVGEVAASPAQVFAVVTDYAEFPQFMPYIDYTRVIAKDQASPTENIFYVFFYVEPPLISPRYYTLKLTDEKDPDGDTNAFRSAWVQENGKYRLTPADPSLQGKLKDTGDAVETRFNRGCWYLRPMPGGSGTQVTYYVWSDPGGSIPSWIANKANTVALPKLWDALAARLNKLYP